MLTILLREGETVCSFAESGWCQLTHRTRSVNSDEATTNWRAVCGKSACTVRREGELRLSPPLSADAYVEISVEDSGPGLTLEQQERIFEAFYTTKAGGTGLGLAVTKTLLEKMGATIESGKGARGARFRVLLPAGVEA